MLKEEDVLDRAKWENDIHKHSGAVHDDTLRAIRHRQRSTPGGHLLARCIYHRTGPDLPDA